MVLITIESLRADHVGCYGYSKPTTPALDAFAETATRFDRNFTVTSWTLSSHASMFTGLYPSAHQVVLPRDRLADSYETIAEHLREGGYQTAGFISGIYLRRPYRLDQGFEHYDDSACNPADEIDKEPTSPRMQSALRRFFELHRDPSRPLFLFAYYWDVHYGYFPPVPYDKMFRSEGDQPIDLSRYDRNPAIRPDLPEPALDYLQSQYDGEIRYTDEHLAMLFALLREQGIWDNAAIFVTADHGEEFFEHGAKGHKNNLYEESLHVPLLLKAPLLEQGVTDSRIVSAVDFFPTILHLVGEDPRPSLPGRSLLLSPEDKSRTVMHELITTWYFHSPNRQTGVRRSQIWTALRRGTDKLISVLEPGGDRRFELFDLSTDPDETRPLGGAAGTRLAELQVELKQLVRRNRRLAAEHSTVAPAVLQPEEEALLKSMGYLGNEEAPPEEDSDRR